MSALPFSPLTRRGLGRWADEDIDGDLASMARLLAAYYRDGLTPDAATLANLDRLHRLWLDVLDARVQRGGRLRGGQGDHMDGHHNDLALHG